MWRRSLPWNAGVRSESADTDGAISGHHHCPPDVPYEEPRPATVRDRGCEPKWLIYLAQARGRRFPTIRARLRGLASPETAPQSSVREDRESCLYIKVLDLITLPMNHKCILRLMRRYGIVTKIRKKKRISEARQGDTGAQDSLKSSKPSVRLGRARQGFCNGHHLLPLQEKDRTSISLV